MRRVTYRSALTALFFSGAWLVLGFLFLMTPVPSALGIGGELIQVWIVIFLLALGVGGAMLTLAALNGLFPPVVRAPKRRTTVSPTGQATTTPETWQRPSSAAPSVRRQR
jgi:hypothetical protein